MPHWEFEPATRGARAAATILLAGNIVILGGCIYGALVTHGVLPIVMAVVATLSGLLLLYNAVMLFVAYVLMPRAWNDFAKGRN
jgi:hypothetical protein